MRPRDRPHICYRGKRYRDIEHRLENTYGEGDCVRVVDTDQEQPEIYIDQEQPVTDTDQEQPVTDTEQEQPVVDTEQQGPMADDEDARRYRETLLKTVQDLSRQMETMGQRIATIEVRQREAPRGFQTGEGSGTSHHMPEREAIPLMASHAPTRSTMPTFLRADTGAGA